MHRLFIWGVLFCSVGLISCARVPGSEQEADLEKTAMDSTSGLPNLKKAGLLNVQLGLGYLKQGDITRAKSKLIHALELVPRDPEPYSAMAYFYETVSEKKRAEKFYRKAIRLGGRSGKYHNNYAAFLCRERRFSESEQAFLVAIQDENYTRTAEVYENVGICALDWGKPEKAESYFETALQRDPRRTRAILELARLKYEAKKFKVAKILLNTFSKYSQPTSASLRLEIQLAKALGDHDTQASRSLLLKSFSHVE